jgi:hypothetical protein
MRAEGIEQAAVGGNVHQCPVRMLAVDLRESARDLAQQVEAHRLVVDGRTAGAVGVLDAADDEFALGIDPLFLQDGEGRVAWGQRETRRHHAALGACAHQGGIAPGAQRQPQRIEQDGLARTGLPGEDGEAPLERDVELLDQDDVANGESGQHGPHFIAESRPQARG